MMKNDEYKELFDSIKIRDDVYEKLVSDTMQQYRKRKSRRQSGWFRAAVAGIPALAVLCLVIFFRLSGDGNQGPAVQPVELERTTEEETAADQMGTEQTAPEQTAEVKTTEEQTTADPASSVTDSAIVPPITEAVPGEKAAELFGISGIVPLMEDVQKAQLNIAVETFFGQKQKLEELKNSDLFTDSDGSGGDAAESLVEAVASMEVKPVKVYHLRYQGTTVDRDLAQFLVQKFGNISMTALFANWDSLSFTSLMDTVITEEIEEAMSPVEQILCMTERRYSMERVDALVTNEVIIFQENSTVLGGRAGWFYYEFSPCFQKTMIVSAGYCPDSIVPLLLDGTLEYLGYEMDEYDYYDMRWGSNPEVTE
ncbi:MAG: hypothetical protein IJ468_07170 [Lachnospiraceae bacterium]|nr:hypothetical protein [Lachnospiraceae bacterium]